MGTWIKSSEKKSDEYIEVNACSQEVLNHVDHHTVRRDGRIDFGLQYVAEGRCYYEDDGEEKYIEKGCALLHFPNVRQHYYFKKRKKPPWFGAISQENFAKCLKNSIPGKRLLWI